MNLTKYTNREHGSKELLSLLMVILLFSSTGFGMFLINVSQVQAQTPEKYTLLEPLPCIESPATVDGNGNTIPEVTCPQSQITEVDFQGYVQYMFNLLIALAAVAAVFMIVWGGFEYMSSDSYSKKSEGLNKLKNALSGLLLVLCSYLILKTIDPRLVAIPVNLVEPIKIMCTDPPNIPINDPGCKSSNSSDFFNKLISEAEKYQIKDQQLTQTAIEARNSTVTLNEQKKQKQLERGELVYDQGISEDDPRIQNLDREIRDIDNNIIKNQAKVAVALSKARNSAAILSAETKIKQLTDPQGWLGMEGTASMEKVDKIIDDNITFINQTRSARTSQLLEMGANDSIKDVNDHANYSELVLEIVRADFVLDKTISPQNSENAYSYKQDRVVTKRELRAELLNNINTMSNKVSGGNIQDPILKAELQAKLENSRNLINTKFPQE